jgi:hypothetical protein
MHTLPWILLRQALNNSTNSTLPSATRHSNCARFDTDASGKLAFAEFLELSK